MTFINLWLCYPHNKVKFENGTKKYRSTKVDYHTKERKSHVTLYNDPRRNKKKLLPLIENHDRILFTCLNDKIDHSQKSAAVAEEDVRVNFYDVLFPTPSKFEWIYSSSSTKKKSTTMGTTTTVTETKIDDEKTEETTGVATTINDETKAPKPIIHETDNYQVVVDAEFKSNTKPTNWSNTLAFYAGGTTLLVVSTLKLRRKFR